MQAWHTPEGYDVGCQSQRRKLKGMCHYTHLSLQERDCIAKLRGTREGQSAISRQRSAGTAPASATSSRGTAATGALGHVLPKRRADEHHRRCRAKRRLSDPALTQKVCLLIMDRHWSLEQIDGRLRLEGGGRCVVEPADYSTVRSVATLELPGSGPEGKMRRHLRSKRPKTKGKIEILHTVKERPKQADERSRLGKGADDTLVVAGPVCLLVLADRAVRLLAAERATTTAGASLRPRSGCYRDAPSRRSPLSGASSSQGMQSSQRPFEACSSTSATPTIYGRS
jgi:IS30 family transposase